MSIPDQPQATIARTVAVDLPSPGVPAGGSYGTPDLGLVCGAASYLEVPGQGSSYGRKRPEAGQPHSFPALSGLEERVPLENATHATAGSMCSVAAEREVEGFIAKFAPEMQSRIRGCRAKLQAQFPTAMELVYDNYNFFVIGFGPTRRPSDAILSLAAHRRGVNLCFLQRGAELPDPTSILRGNGKVVRNVALDSVEDLNRSDVQALIHASLELARMPMEEAEGPSTIIQSVSAKQRTRR